MVFPFNVILVVSHQLVLVGQFKQNGKEPEEFFDNFCMAFTAEGFDFLNVGLEDGWMLAGMIAVELGNVVDLDVVFDAVAEPVM
jgi:hypothetical protein